MANCRLKFPVSSRRAAIVDRGGKDDEHKEKGGDRFEDHGGESGKVADQFRRAEGYGAPRFFGDDGSEEEGCGDAAEDLLDANRSAELFEKEFHVRLYFRQAVS